MLEQVVVALQAGLGGNLVAVALFGSQARGEATAGRDWDLLVIAKGMPGQPFERRLLLKHLLPIPCRGIVSILARTPAEFEAHVPSLYLDIALDGCILHDPQGYIAARLKILRQLIERAGLQRQRSEVGYVWRWQRQPAGAWDMTWELIGDASHR